MGGVNSATHGANSAPITVGRMTTGEGSAIRVDTLRKLVTIQRGGKIGNPRLRLSAYPLCCAPGTLTYGHSVALRACAAVGVGTVFGLCVEERTEANQG